jgi:Uma2 family endonuclease
MASTTAQEIIRLTYDDYAKLPNDGLRYEIIEGELFMSPAPKPKHERVQMNLYDHLKRHIFRHNLGELFVAPQDVVLEEHTVVQPDLFFISQKRLHVVTDVNTQGPPDIVIEVESDHDQRADWVKKRDAYARYGVKELWHVRPAPRTVDIYRRVGRNLDQVERVLANGKLTSPLLPRLSIPLKKIWV